MLQDITTHEVDTETDLKPQRDAHVAGLRRLKGNSKELEHLLLPAEMKVSAEEVVWHRQQLAGLGHVQLTDREGHGRRLSHQHLHSINWGDTRGWHGLAGLGGRAGQGCAGRQHPIRIE